VLEAFFVVFIFLVYPKTNFYFVDIVYIFCETSTLLSAIPYYGIQYIRTQPARRQHSVLLSQCQTTVYGLTGSILCTLHENIVMSYVISLFMYWWKQNRMLSIYPVRAREKLTESGRAMPIRDKITNYTGQ
jgi:hypothetical protein